MRQWLYVAGVAAVVVAGGIYQGYVPPDPLLIAVVTVAMLVSGTVLGVPALYSWVRESISSARESFALGEVRPAERRAAADLGLTAQRNDVSSIDLAFPFLAARRFRWSRGGQITHVFAGTWHGIPVTVFDYKVPKSESSADEYTCAQLATPLDAPPTTLRRCSGADRIGDLIRRRVVRTGDPAIDAWLHVESSGVDAGRSIAQALAPMLETRAYFVVELRPRSLLCCVPRVPEAMRKELLGEAAALRAALPAALPRVHAV